MADINPNDSATLTDGLEIDSYDDVVNLLGAGEAAAMLADAAGNRFNRQDIMKAILNGGDIHLDYWPEYGEYDYAARICGELLADTSLAWADGLIDPDKIKTHKGLTAGDLSHAVTCVLTDRFNDGLDEARLADCKNIANEFARAIESRLGSGHLGRALYVDGDCLRDDLTDKFEFSYDIDFSGLTFKTSLILSVNDLYYEGDVIDAASDWQEDYLPCVSAIGAARARMTGGSTSPPRTTGLSRVPRTSPRASSTSCAPRRARPSRRSSTTPLRLSSAASARISSICRRIALSGSRSSRRCRSTRSWMPVCR